MQHPLVAKRFYNWPDQLRRMGKISACQLWKYRPLTVAPILWRWSLYHLKQLTDKYSVQHSLHFRHLPALQQKKDQYQTLFLKKGLAFRHRSVKQVIAAAR